MNVVSFSAASGTGKTTLLEKVVSLLVSRGHRIGVLKHDAHSFDIDHPGKDSHRLSAAGAEVMVIASSDKLAMVRRLAAPLSPETIVESCFVGLDLVLLEGFGGGPYPVVLIRRTGVPPKEGSACAIGDPRVIAVVTDGALEAPLPVLDLNNPRQVADFLEERLLR